MRYYLFVQLPKKQPITDYSDDVEGLVARAYEFGDKHKQSTITVTDCQTREMLFWKSSATGYLGDLRT